MVRRHGRRAGRSATRSRATQPHGLGRLGSRLRDRRRAGMERPRSMVGHLARAGVAGGSPARPRRRARHRRAGLRNGVRVGVARATGRAPGRPRQLAGAARDRTAPATGARTHVSRPAGRRRARAAAGRVRRPGRLGVRRLPLVRSAPVDSRGSAPPPSRRPADVPREQRAPHAVHARRRRGRRGRDPAAPVLRDAPRGVGIRTTPSSSTSPTAIGSACCAGMASTWKS